MSEGVLTEDQWPQRLLRQDDLGETAPPEVILQGTAHGASLSGETGRKRMPRKSRNSAKLNGKTSSVTLGHAKADAMSRVRSRTKTSHEHLDILGVVETPDPPFPAWNVCCTSVDKR